jgi:hypothetical protein
MWFCDSDERELVQLEVSMKKLSVRTSMIVLAVAAMAVGSASAAHAQDRIDAKVSFPFLVNGVQLPAGTYEVKGLSDGDGVLTIESTDGQNAVSVTTIPTPASNEERDTKLVFNKINNQYVLVGVDFGDSEGRQIMPNTSIADAPVMTAEDGAHK